MGTSCCFTLSFSGRGSDCPLIHSLSSFWTDVARTPATFTLQRYELCPLLPLPVGCSGLNPIWSCFAHYFIISLDKKSAKIYVCTKALAGKLVHTFSNKRDGWSSQGIDVESSVGWPFSRGRRGLTRCLSAYLNEITEDGHKLQGTLTRLLGI